MKINKLSAVLSIIVILAVFFTGCSTDNQTSSVKQSSSIADSSAADEQSSSVVDSQSSSAADNESSSVTDDQAAGVTVTDMTGREVELPASAERVVALTASDCEIIYALGQGDKLVGRGEYCDYPEEVLEVESVQSGEDTNVEQIIALEPDIVVMSSMAQSEEQVDQLEQAGIAVIVSEASTIDEVYEAITLIGDCLGAADEAEAMVSDMKQSFEAIQQDLPEAGGSIYFEVSPLEYGLWTAGSDTFMDEIAAMLNLENCFSDVSGWAEVSQEQVIERNPDYIVTITMYYGEGETPDEEICNRSGWENINAVQNSTVFVMDSNELSRPGPRLADAAESLRELVYGS